MASTPDALSERFLRFAEHECRGASPLYERLARGISGDPQLLALAAHATSRPVPNLFFAAVHFLLLRGAAHELAAFYPTLGGGPVAGADPYPAFHAFCLAPSAICAVSRSRDSIATRS